MENPELMEGEVVSFSSPEMHARRGTWDISPRQGLAIVKRIARYPDGRFQGFTLEVELPHGRKHPFYYTAEEIRIARFIRPDGAPVTGD